MRHFILASILLVAIGCSDTPTAPSPTPTPTPTPTPPPPASRTLRWDITASGCTPAPPPNPLPDPTRGSFLDARDGLQPVTWDYQSAAGQRGILTALFREVGSEWHICSWELSDL